MKESLVLRGVSLGRTVGPWSACFSHLIRQAASLPCNSTRAQNNRANGSQADPSTM